MRNYLLMAFVLTVLAVILLTWGSIGSAVLTLALLLGGGLILIQRFLENRDPDDFKWEE